MEYMLFGLPDAVGGTDQCLFALRPPGVATRAAGLQRVDWERRDGAGALLPPGLYLLRLAIQSEAAALTRLVPVGVAH